VRGGVSCYLCGIPLASGDLAIVYRDARFWDQLFFYHAGCWNESDLTAKSSDSLPVPAPAVELPEGYCLVCRAPIETGDLVVREWVREGRGVRIYHAHCVPQGGR
jgi:hypothetical protein